MENLILSILGLKQNANADFSKRVIANDEKITKIFKKRNLDLQQS
jgi:aminomethyltransferase